MRLRFLPLLLLLLLPGVVRAQDRMHAVRPGDTLPKLVFLYGVSEERIRAANGLHSAALRPGTRLVIPSGPASAPSERRAEPARAAEPPRAMPVAGAVTVEETPPPEPAVSRSPERLPPPAESGRGFSDSIALPAAGNIRYNGRWTPPGEEDAWVMDCSNTARWLYRDVLGIELPRTASDQYEWLRARRRLWKARPDSRSLRRKLQPGDLLFWENTYKPVRKPPVTHVMVYLGIDSSGRMMMAGSQGSGGPDVYPFKPEQKMGGYRFFFFFRRDGRFVAYGRP